MFIVILLKVLFLTKLRFPAKIPIGIVNLERVQLLHHGILSFYQYSEQNPSRLFQIHILFRARSQFNRGAIHSLESRTLFLEIPLF